MVSPRLALALAGGVCMAAPAAAQQADLLRGPVSETAINEELLGRSGQAPERTDFPAYQPISVGGVEPEERQDAFTDETPAQPASARLRTRAAPAGVATPEPERTAAPILDEEPTGTVRAGRIDALDEERNSRASPDNARTGPVEGLDRASQDDPFAPLGIRAGSFIVTPTLEQGVGWTSNAHNSPGGGASTFSETGLRLEAISDWASHSATLSADGRYRKSLSGEEISDFDGGAAAGLRLDLSGGFTATAGADYRIGPETAASPNSVEGAVSEPLRQTLTGTAGLAKDVGKLRFGIAGEVVRDVYGDAELESGAVLSQRDRNSTLATVSLRTGYEISPALQPFVEAEIGRRVFDETVDADGYARSADRYALRGGVAFDFGEKLTGEIAAGWLTERPDDDRLAAISGASVKGNLAWSPMRGTTVELDASTEVEGSTQAGETGSLLYAGSLALSRQLRHDLTGRARLGLDWRDYSGSSDSDLIARGELGLTWWLNRHAGVTGRLSHEIQRSTLPGRDYDATGVYLGMTLQR